jgi:aldose 1-epimerase
MMPMIAAIKYQRWNWNRLSIGRPSVARWKEVRLRQTDGVPLRSVHLLAQQQEKINRKTRRFALMTVMSDGIVVLCSGPARCEVVPQAGGAIAGFWWQQGSERLHWLRPAGASAAARGDARQMSCFPTLPYNHRLRDGRFQFCGQEVVDGSPEPGDRHARYGHGWRRGWQAMQRDEDVLVLEYRHEADAWPWSYHARQRLQLSAACLSLTLEIENLSGGLMPAGLGFHLALPVTPAARLGAAALGLWRNDDQALPTEWTRVPSAAAFSDRPVADLSLDTVFTGWDGKAAIAWPERRAGLALAAEQPILSFLGVEKAADADTLCLAPASQCADAVNLARTGVPGTGIRVLAPGARRSATLTLHPERF